MTPDRPDQTPAEEAENGVLSAAGSLDSAGIGFLGLPTEQVSVILPSGDDEFVDDEDVIGDEMPYDDSSVGIDSPAEIDAIDTDTAEGEIVDDGSDAAASSDAYGAIDADVVESEPQSAPADEFDFDGDLADASPEVLAAEHALQLGNVEARIEPAIVQPAVPTVPAATAAVATVASASVPTTSGPVPHSRREAHLAEVSLTSKRFGEFEPSRETADLLTPDRLLDPHRTAQPEPEGAWQHFVYSISGHRINLGDSKLVRERKALDRRIATPLSGRARFVPVLSRKGGVGKTTVTTLLGMALADARDDRIIAIDANPDRGTLAERIARTSGKTVRDLVRGQNEVTGYNDVSTIVARDETRLDVLASDTDPRVSEALSDEDYNGVASLAAHYYSIVLTDTGTGIVHSVMGATLERADQLVVVAGLSVDEARLASETLTWLETNGYAAAVRDAIVVLNTSRPGGSLVLADELETHFASRVRSVVRLPYDAHIATGSAISFRELQPGTREAARQLAAVVVDGLRSVASSAA